MVYRCYVEKKPGLAAEADALLHEAKNLLGIASLSRVRIFNRYDAEGLSADLFRDAEKTVFSEPQLDTVIFWRHNSLNNANFLKASLGQLIHSGMDH